MEANEAVFSLQLKVFPSHGVFFFSSNLEHMDIYSVYDKNPETCVFEYSESITFLLHHLPEIAVKM